MKTIYFLILNEVVEYFIKILKFACVKYPYNIIFVFQIVLYLQNKPFR